AISLVSSGFASGVLYSQNFLPLKEEIRAALGDQPSVGAISESAKVIQEAMELIIKNSLREVSVQILRETAIEGMLESLQDEHAVYYSPQDYQLIMEDYRGQTSGVGMFVTKEDDQLVVVAPIEGTPAYRAGIKSGDIILAVDGQFVQGMDIDKAVAMIRGEKGTRVRIKLQRGESGEIYEVELVREEFRVPSVVSKMMEDKIGYVGYRFFSVGGAAEVEKALKELKEEGARGIIFDLRHNFGGPLTDAVEVSRLFVREGNIVTVRGKEGTEEVYQGTGTGDEETPMVVLIDRFTASASEVTAGALQDNNRAVLVGEKTFGKGSVQVIEPLPDGSGIKLTNALFYLPSGRSNEGVGLEPDVVIKSEGEETEDIIQNKGMEVLKELMGGKGVKDFKEIAHAPRRTRSHENWVIFKGIAHAPRRTTSHENWVIFKGAG
ncbi:S41 family peptidase, partial [Candidatus Hakubella thermalkaliphila]